MKVIIERNFTAKISGLM